MTEGFDDIARVYAIVNGFCLFVSKTLRLKEGDLILSLSSACLSEAKQHSIRTAATATAAAAFNKSSSEDVRRLFDEAPDAVISHWDQFFLPLFAFGDEETLSP